MNRHARLNRVYRLIWNRVKERWEVASELSSGRGKTGSSRRALLAAALGLTSAQAFGLPTDGQIVSGSGQISQCGSQMTVDQSSQNLAINWQSFGIGTGEGLTFNQPGVTAIALNRVLGQNASEILGSLKANGQVFILNPNGVLFGQGAQVSVGGLLASTLNLSDSDFASGNYHFSGDSTASVSNAGSLTAAKGGYIALLGASVSNSGSLSASGGTVALAAGKAITVKLDNGSLLGLNIDKGALQALIDNGGLIESDGGQVLLTAKAADSLSSAVINTRGVIQAHTLDTSSGKILLLGDTDHGSVNVAGTLDASAPTQGDGGFVETSAAHVKVADGTQVTTKATQGSSGHWLIDPADYTIAASGGDISGATLSGNLNNGSITIQSSSGTVNPNGTGAINVNDAVSWSAANTLTLNAIGNINVNANITASNAGGKLALQYGQGAVASGNTATYNIASGNKINLQAGNNFSTKLGSDGGTTTYTVLTSLGNAGSTTGTDLQGIAGNLGGNYVLGADIDASATSGWNNGAGFNPLGSNNGVFSGKLDGLGHTISNLVVNRSSTNFAALVGFNTGTIRNIGVIGGRVTGNQYAGNLVGSNSGTINNAYATGAVSGSYSVGGLAGFNSGTISNAYATGAVSGGNDVGGLVGMTSQGTISNAYATGSVSAGTYAGGLVGFNGGMIGNAYATGVVSGGSYVGGLVGWTNATIGNAYATGAVSGSNNIGGLVGVNYQGTISNAYATGAVSGSNGVGGLAGYTSSGTINNAYAMGAVSGGSNVGGLVGATSNGTTTNSYWNTQTSGQSSSAGGTGLTTAQLEAALPTGFSSSTWGNASNQSTPYLLSNPGPVLIATDSSYTLYQIILNATQLQNINNALGKNYALGNSIDLSSISNFNPLGNGSTAFSGKFDGLNFTVNNLSINLGSTTYVGLFGWSSGTIRNVGVVGGSVSGNNDVGALVGINYNGTISNAYATGTVSGNSYVGGLAGYNNGVISNAYATGAVSGVSYVGGLLGLNNRSVNSAYATGTVLSSGTSSGGLAGYNNGAISNAYATGAVSGVNYVGGLLGLNNNSVNGAYATGTVLSSGSYSGGLTGYNNGAISNAYATGAVSGSSNVGGLVGLAYQGTISNAYATGAVKGSSYVGGLAGYNIHGTISNAYATGAVSGGSNYVGALAGQNDGTINLAYATGSVTGSSDVGGLVGDNFGTISNAYATGAVSGGSLVGGLVALNYGTITNAYALGAVSGGSNVGGLAGYNGKIITNGYWNTQTTGQSSSSGGTGLTTAQLEAALPNGFSSSIWGNANNQSTPYLLSNPGPVLIATDSSYTLYQIILNAAQLQNINNALGKNYALGNSIDLSSISNFNPLGNDSTAFSGKFDGLNFTVNNLNIDRGDSHGVGLFSYNAGTIRNVGVVGGRVAGSNTVGGLVAYNNGTISNAYATSAVSGSYYAGGLVGYNDYGTIINAYATGPVSGGTYLGGLVAFNNGGTISNAYATGTVSGGGGYFGGLVGVNQYGGAISNAYATGAVSGSYDVGGLVGFNRYGTIINAYATGAALGSGSYIGGLVGLNAGPISNAYATGAVSGGSSVGGLVGADFTPGTTSGYWDTQTTGQSGSASGTGLTSAQMQQLASFSGWSISSQGGDATVWRIYEGNTAPLLRSFLTQANLGTVTTTYNGGTQDASSAVSGLNSAYVLGGAASGRNAGTYSSGYYSSQQGYDFSGGALVIDKAALTLAAVTDSKTYDGTTDSSQSVSVTGLQGSDSVSATQHYQSKNVLGTNNSTLQLDSGYTINDGNGGNNYNLTVTQTAAGTITPATLTLAAVTDSKTYDGGTNSNKSVDVSGVQQGDSVTATQAYQSKNVLGSNGSTLQVAGYTINDGNNGNNYAVTTQSASGTITPAALTLAAVTDSKTYDATTNSSKSVSVTNLQQGDSVTATQAYASKNVLGANGSTLEVAGYTIDDGNNGANYAVTTQTAAGTITPAALTLAAVTDSKTYDGGTSSGQSVNIDGVQQGDSVTATQAYQSKNVLGTNGSTLQVAGYTINDGNNGANYAVTTQTAAGTITPASLTLAAVTDSKTYDGGTGSSKSVDVSGVQQGDSVTATQAYQSKNVLGTNGSTLQVAGYTIDDGNNGNNYSVATQTASGTITPATLTLAAVTDSKTYDGGTSSSRTVNIDGVQQGDSVTATQAYQSKHVLGTNGSTLQVAGYTINDGNNGNNYSVATQTAAGTITPATLTLAAVTDSKTYDGGTGSSQSVDVSGVQQGDSVTATQAYQSKNVLGSNGSTLQVAGYTIDDGNNGANYAVTTQTAAGTITPATLTLAAVTDSKTYDGSTSSSQSVNIDGVQQGDSVTATQAYQSKNVLGTNGSTLQVAGYTINDGNNGNNYSVTTQTASGTITPAALTLAAVTDSKTYDGGTGSNKSVDVSGVQQGDSVMATQTYQSKNVLGTNGSTLQVAGYTINDGNNGNNYSVATQTAAGTITPATLTLAAVTDSKTYDGGTSSSQTVNIDGVQQGDSVTATQAYQSKHVLGTNGSTLQVDGYTINDGNNGNNYSVATQTAAGTITPATLTLAAVTDSKTYDGGTGSSQTVNIDGVQRGDSVTATQAYQSKNVLGSNGSTLQVAGYTINDGNNGNNYSVATQTAAGTITPATLTLAAVTDSKTYDGGTSSSQTVNIDGVQQGDSVTATQAYQSKNVLGTNGSTLQVAGYTIDDGNNGNNYSVTTQNASGTITPAALSIAAVSDTKTYDATTTSSKTVSVSGLQGSDSVTASQRYMSKDVLGTNGSTLQVAGYTINDGNNGNNYAVSLTQTAAGTITPATLTLAATTDTKTYDTNTSSNKSVSINGLQGTDTATATQSYQSKNVLGTNGSTLQVNSGYSVSDGNGGRNYSVVTQTAAGTITPATLTLTASTDSKAYDGTTSSSKSIAISGLLGSDTATATQAFASKNVLGTNGSTLTLGSANINDGNGGNNYALNVRTAAGTITPVALTLSAVSDTKTYDGTTNSSKAVSVSGLKGTDTVSATQSYASKNVLGSNASTLAVSTYTVNDGNNGKNYVTTATQTAKGTITPAALSIAATPDTKVYDGTTVSNAPVTVVGLKTGDSVSATQSYQSKNVLGANGSTLQLNGCYTLTDGNNGKNYTVTVTQTAKGTITPATLTLVASTDSKVYDATTTSTKSVSILGLKGSDTASATQSYLSKNVLGSNGSTLQVNGNYCISDGNSGKNYSVVTQNALGTITPATLTLSALSASKVYDGTTSSSVPVLVSGLKGSDTATGTQSYLSKNVLGTNGSTLQVSSYSINDGNGGNNYSVVNKTALGTITPATLTLSAVSDSKVYDATTSSSKAVKTSGLKGGDTVAATQSYLSKNVMGTNGSLLQVNSGYSINDGNGGKNYTVLTLLASGTITPAPLTITGNNASKTTGTANPTLTATITGLQGSDTQASLSGKLTVTTTATTSSPVGNYPIVPSGLSSTNYSIKYVNGVLTVVPASTLASTAQTATPSSVPNAGSVTSSGASSGLTVENGGIRLPAM